MIIYNFKKTIIGKVLNRPSLINKSPYLADVLINNKKFIAHSPSLGLSGLIKPGSFVILEKNENENQISEYRIVSVKIKEFETKNKFIYVGANPVLVNQLFRTCIEKNLIKFPKIKNFNCEVQFYGSRIDFKLIDVNNVTHVIECKYAPTVDYHPDHKPHNKVSIGNKIHYKRAAIFPDGWQYKKGSVVSERAVKHVKSLIEGTKNKIKCYNFYFCLRNDVEYFRANYEKDITFSNLLKKANDLGVIIKAFKLNYSKNNIKFVKEIPVNFN